MKTKLKTFNSLRSWSGRNLFAEQVEIAVREATGFLVDDLHRKRGALSKGVIFVCFSWHGGTRVCQHEIAIGGADMRPFIRVRDNGKFEGRYVDYDGTPQGLLDALTSHLAPARLAA